MTFTQAAITPAHRAEHAKLRARLDAATAAVDRSVSPTDRQEREVDDAWDALVDWVEAEHLVYTELDPRGPDTDPEDDL